MKIQNTLTEDSLLLELGARLKSKRLDMELSQADLAEQAGVSKRTIERIENGSSTQSMNLLRVFRVLGLIESFYSAIPEPGPRPMDLVTRSKKVKKRVSHRKNKESSERQWEWGDK